MSEPDLPNQIGPALRLFIWVSPAFAFGFEGVSLFWAGHLLDAFISVAIGFVITLVLARWQSIKAQLLPAIAEIHKAVLVKGRAFLILRLQESWYAEIYRAILASCLRLIDRAFGSSRPAASGYLFCTVIAFMYILFGFIGAWALGGPGRIGQTILLPENWSGAKRQLFLMLLIITCFNLYVFTAYPLSAVNSIRHFLRRVIRVSTPQRILIAVAVSTVLLCLVQFATDDAFLTFLLGFSILVLGSWLASLTFFGGALIGAIAAGFSGFRFDGTNRFLAAAAILGVVALGGSFGTRPVATLLTRKYRAYFTHSSYFSRMTPWLPSITDRLFPYLVFGIVGAVGGATYLAFSARTYSYLIGPDVDQDLINAIGFTAESTAFPIAGAIAGLIGGILAGRFGRGAVVFSGFVSALLLITVLGTHLLSHYNLYDYFGAKNFLGTALINILLFFIILPPINAFWDWLAWEISRTFGRNLLKHITLNRILRHITGGILLGATLLIGLTAADTLAISAFNNWMVAHTSFVPLPIDSLAKAALDHPRSPEGLWISMMLFSTFLPTLCHLTFIVFGILLIRTPEAWRSRLALTLAVENKAGTLMLPILYFAFLPIFGVAVVGALIWFIFSGFALLGAPISRLLYELVHVLAS